MRTTGSIVLLGVLLGLSGCSKGITDSDIKFIELSEVRTLTERAQSKPGLLLLVDPRSPRQFGEGHIPGASNISLAAVDPERPNPGLRGHEHVIVYGDGPGSAPAKAMTKKLMTADIDGVRFFAGGLRDWSAVYPVARSPSAGEGGG